ncbi:MAG TPA: Maf family protein [Solirubrobacteraceae bacterium]|nr:Maf family protein [Solirubrobacteraceae bacterium]
MPRLVLASRSPQRRAILESLGVPFELRPVDVVEEDDGVPRTVARVNALRKAVAGRAAPGEVVLGVDTLVTVDLEIWGKPPNEAAARETLRRLAGRTHEVISGVALVDADGSVRAATATTRVTFRPMDEPTLDWYLESREWEERAGGYAIQGRGGALVERIEGDYLNVVGLPVGTLLDLWPGLLALER